MHDPVLQKSLYWCIITHCEVSRTCFFWKKSSQQRKCLCLLFLVLKLLGYQPLSAKKRKTSCKIWCRCCCYRETGLCPWSNFCGSRIGWCTSSRVAFNVQVKCYTGPAASKLKWEWTNSCQRIFVTRTGRRPVWPVEQWLLCSKCIKRLGFWFWGPVTPVFLLQAQNPGHCYPLASCKDHPLIKLSFQPWSQILDSPQRELREAEHMATLSKSVLCAAHQIRELLCSKLWKVRWCWTSCWEK